MWHDASMNWFSKFKQVNIKLSSGGAFTKEIYWIYEPLWELQHNRIIMVDMIDYIFSE